MDTVRDAPRAHADRAATLLFDGPGEMRARSRAFDWASTPLGPVDEWPLGLRTIVTTMLASRHPMFLWWGPELVQLFNDAYRPSFAEGGRDVRALGARGADFWTEIWDIIGPQIEQVMSGGEATWHEDQLVPIERNGSIEDVWWTYSYSPAFDDGGSVGGVLVVCQETTRHVRARQEIERLLIESEEARAAAEAARERIAGLQSLTAALSTAASVEDIAEVMVAHATSLLGAVGTVVARVSADGAYLELVRASDMPDAIQEAWRRFPISAPVPLAEVARTGEPLFLESRTEWIARYPDLEPVLLATRHHANVVTPLMVDGRILGVLGAAFDAPRVFDSDYRALVLTLARQCAQALERARLFEAEHAARMAAELANRAKSEFLAVMSHELRTPLNAIDGYAELMELGIRGPVTNEQSHDLARIRTSQRHLLGLINDVLNYTRLEAAAVRYEIGEVLLDEILTTCDALTAPQRRTKGLSFRYDGCDPALAVRADPEKLQQIVLNLLTNAIKFTDRGGQIHVACIADASSVRVTVSDTGVGIAADQLERIFEPFVQVDSRLARSRDGVGLGLAISRRLAQGMGGDLTAESTPGVGSAFTMILPRSEASVGRP